MIDDPMDRRLHEWAAWLRGGTRGEGYPTISVLHESWMPPPPGRMPNMRTSSGSGQDARHRETHLAVACLSVRLANTVIVHYVLREPAATAAVMLDCAPSTVSARLVEARRKIGALCRAEPAEVAR